MSFGADDACASTVAGALGTLRARGVDARMRLVGQPGAAGTRAQRWREAAERAGCAGALSFSGVVDRPELSREVSAAPLVLFPNAAGPITAKSTIASALAHGRPVVAIDGPKRWDGFAPAMALAPPSAPALADCLERLLADDAERRRLAAAGAELYERELAPEVTARRLLAFARRSPREPGAARELLLLAGSHRRGRLLERARAAARRRGARRDGADRHAALPELAPRCAAAPGEYPRHRGAPPPPLRARGARRRPRRVAYEAGFLAGGLRLARRGPRLIS